MIQRLIPAGIRSDWLLVVRLDLHHRRLLDHRHGLRPDGQRVRSRLVMTGNPAAGGNATGIYWLTAALEAIDYLVRALLEKP